MTTARTPPTVVGENAPTIDLHRYAVEVVPRLPSSYPRRHALTCGESNVRAVLDAFGVDFIPNPDPPPRERLFGLSHPRDIAAALRRHGLDTAVRSAGDLHDDSRLALLRGHVDSHEPVIIAIANGYLSRHRDSRLAPASGGHFVTIYGYDAVAGVFFAYDPCLAGDSPTGLPAGNDVRTESQVLRDWRGPLSPTHIGMHHTYIPVGV